MDRRLQPLADVLVERVVREIEAEERACAQRDEAQRSRAEGSFAAGQRGKFSQKTSKKN